MNLDNSSNPTSTPSLRRSPAQQDSHLDSERHHIYRKVVGMLIWAAQVRPDLQFTAKDHARHLAAPTEWDWQHLKHTLRYLKGMMHYKFLISPQLPQGHSLPLRQFDDLFTSTPTVTAIGLLTSSLGSPHLARSHQYFNYCSRSTSEHRVQSLHQALKPNSAPSASASATACTSASYFKGFNIIFNDRLSTFGNLDTQYDFTTLTTTKPLTLSKSLIHIFTDSTSALSLSNKLGLEQALQTHRFALPLCGGHPGHRPRQHPESHIPQQSSRHLHQMCHITSVGETSSTQQNH